MGYIGMEANAPVLLVEDDRVDVMMVQRALTRAGCVHPLVVASTGQEALDLLRQLEGPARPSLILLDLNLPIMNGHEFMEEAKRQTDLRAIPMVVLSTSDRREDVQRSFELGAAGYFVKSIDLSRFVKSIETLIHYWSLSVTPT
jgi:CheY-like chemotaxis protein